MQKNQKKDEAEEEKKRRMRLRGELPPEDEEEEEDWDPERIYGILPFKNKEGNQHFIVASTKQYNGFIYLCDINNPRPYEAIPIPEGLHVSYMSMSERKAANIIVIGYDNGDIQLIFDFNWDARMSVKYHDAHAGGITAVAFSHDDQFFLTAAEDGLIFAHQFDRKAAAQESQYDPLKDVEGAQFLPEDEKKEVKAKKLKAYQEDNPPVHNEITEENAMDEASLAITIKTKEPTNVDVENPDIYSIQQDKLKSEEDRRRAAAEKKKDGVRDQINELRKEFSKIREKNNGAQDHL